MQCGFSKRVWNELFLLGFITFTKSKIFPKTITFFQYKICRYEKPVSAWKKVLERFCISSLTFGLLSSYFLLYLNFHICKWVWDYCYTVSYSYIQTVSIFKRFILNSCKLSLFIYLKLNLAHTILRINNLT